MKQKTQPIKVSSGNNFEQALYEGLNKTQKNWAKNQVKKFNDMGFAIPYGIIRKEALEK